MAAVQNALFWAVTLGFGAAALCALQRLFLAPVPCAPAGAVPGAAAQRRAPPPSGGWRCARRCGAVRS